MDQKSCQKCSVLTDGVASAAPRSGITTWSAHLNAQHEISYVAYCHRRLLKGCFFDSYHLVVQSGLGIVYIIVMWLGLAPTGMRTSSTFCQVD